MKRKILFIALTTAALGLGAGTVSADADQPWHLTGMVGGMSLDSHRQADDDGVWGQIGFGRFLTKNFSLDLEYDEFEADFPLHATVVPGSTYDSWKLSNLGLMGRYYFTEAAVRPYLAFGAGYLKHRNVLSEDSNLSLRAGIGLEGTIAKHWSVRAQALWQGDHDGSTFAGTSKYTDWIYSIGLSFNFGGHEPPPPPPAAPPPPPPPPPNPDLDGDGVLNERDKCPNTRPGAVVDLDGCEVEAVIELEGVHFDFDKATLRPEAMVVLNEAAALLNNHDKVIVEIAGHTDSKGSEQYNQGLSERRATAVKDYLESKGVKASRLSARGYGENRPVASNDTEEGRAENRRVEMIIIER